MSSIIDTPPQQHSLVPHLLSSFSPLFLKPKAMLHTFHSFILGGTFLRPERSDTEVTPPWISWLGPTHFSFSPHFFLRKSLTSLNTKAGTFQSSLGRTDECAAQERKAGQVVGSWRIQHGISYNMLQA